MSVNVFLKHQLRIARKTLQMDDSLVAVLGGLTKEEARALLEKHDPAFLRKLEAKQK